MDVLHKLSTYLNKRFAYLKKKSDHRGLTLVELVCAIAIMSLVGAGVSSFMILGANTYRSGTTEVELQTEAQMVVNQIGDLVIDSTAKIEGFDEDGNPVLVDAVKITIDSADRHYEISYTGNKVYYYEYEKKNGALELLPEGSSEERKLAENVADFKSDIRDFSSSGILRLYMRLEKDNRAYAAYFTITARNGIYDVDEEKVNASANVVAPSEIVVEPNQDYLLSATVVGVSNNAVTWSLSGGGAGTYVIQEPDGWHLHVGRNETSNSMMLTVSTAAMDGAKPLDTTTVKVHLRRVLELKLNGVLVSGEGMKEGAVYRITSEFVGTTLPRLLGSESDMDYVDPYKFNWLNVELTGASGSASDYYTWTPHGDYAELTLKKDLENVGLAVYARALHPDGMNGSTQTNKTGYSYAEVIGEWKLDSGFKVSVPGGWARGGNSGILLENLPDEWVSWDTVTDWSQWDEEKQDFVKNRGTTNHNRVLLEWWVWKTYINGNPEGIWCGAGAGNPEQPFVQSNNDGAFGNYQGTNSGFTVQVTDGNSLDLKEYLHYDHYSYSSPYYLNNWDHSIPRLKLQLSFFERKPDSWNEWVQPPHVATAIFDVPDVVFQFRNSAPSDPDGAWSVAAPWASGTGNGGHVVYVTPKDNIDIYKSYFQLVNGWATDVVHADYLDKEAGEDDDYIAYNRFVGVIYDLDGYQNDKGHDLTFVDQNGNFIEERPTNQYSALNTTKVSYGSGKNCLVAVKITDAEKTTYCAGDGTIIYEIYEYNFLFNTPALAEALDRYDEWGPNTWDMYNSVDGCDGYLEYHFVQPNVQIDHHGTDKEPLVMYCPTVGQPGLVNGYYYIDEDTRYKVSDNVTEYQTKPHGSGNSAFITQLMLDLKEDGKWHDRAD